MTEFLQDQDPENTWDEALNVYADSPEEAQAKAESIARFRTQGNTIVVCIGCVKMTKSDRKRVARYSCTLRVEAR